MGGERSFIIWVKVQVLGVVVDAVILPLEWLRQNLSLREIMYHESLWWRAGARATDGQAAYNSVLRNSILTESDGFLILGH